VRAYLVLLQTPSVLSLTALQLFARLPLGMFSLAILLHVQARTGSYAVAGAVVAGLSVGEAVAMPMTARLTGVVGVAPVLLAAAGVNALATVALAFCPARPPLLIALGVLAGASVPPFLPVIRALYPQLVAPDVVRLLFSLDTTAQELIWTIGPVLATFLATAVFTGLPLIATAVITLSGTLGFLAALRQRPPRIARNTASFGRALLNREVLLAMVATAALVASFMALEVGIVAELGHDGVLAGVAVAVSSIGSLVGGVLFGHRRIGLPGLVGLLAVAAAGTVLTGLADGVLPLQLCALFASGLGFAPSFATLYLMVSRGVEEQAAAETFGWLSTGTLVGGALGTAVAGVMGDAFGPAGPYAIGAILATLAALSPLIVRATGPLRGLSSG
jgi:MFS family permease